MLTFLRRRYILFTLRHVQARIVAARAQPLSCDLTHIVWNDNAQGAQLQVFTDTLRYGAQGGWWLDIQPVRVVQVDGDRAWWRTALPGLIVTSEDDAELNARAQIIRLLGAEPAPSPELAAWALSIAERNMERAHPWRRWLTRSTQ